MTDASKLEALSDGDLNAILKLTLDAGDGHAGYMRRLERAVAARYETRIADLDDRLHEALKERDTAESWADGVAKAVEQRFRVSVGEHSNAENPWAKAVAILNGEYITDSDQDRRITELEEALRFYATGEHFVLCDRNAWDTVSGEPPNFWCDEAGTATVEDGTVARHLLERTAYAGQVVETLRRERAEADAERRIAELERERDALRALINTPELDDFDKGVPLEAAHQVARWGTAHDRSKSAENWYWLVGYLAGKALRSAIIGDREKALHHTISSAAALRNWHAAIKADTSGAGIGRDEDLKAKAGASSAQEGR